MVQKLPEICLHDFVPGTIQRIAFDQFKNNKIALVYRILKDEGYIEGFNVAVVLGKPTLNVDLKYYAGQPVIEKIQRISKPGLRIYKDSENLPKVMNGLGVAILTTSKGVMTDIKAKAAGIGGEVLCYVA